MKFALSKNIVGAVTFLFAASVSCRSQRNEPDQVQTGELSLCSPEPEVHLEKGVSLKESD